MQNQNLTKSNCKEKLEQLIEERKNKISVSVIDNQIVNIADRLESINMDVFDDIIDIIDSDKKIILVTGKAGTGKTTLVQHLMKDKKINQIILAPTGIAALNAGGQTIHSFFKLPPRLQNLDEIKPLYGKSKYIVKNLDRLIIDEISMVRADLLDSIDYSLRLNRKINLPFGGVQIVMVGDFYQLPPIITPDQRSLLMNLGYDIRGKNNLYALQAKSLNNQDIVKFELTNVFRQEDKSFVELLNNIRTGLNIDESLEMINEKCFGNHKTGRVPMILTGRNQDADYYNQQNLSELKTVSKTYNAKITGDLKLTSDNLPAPSELTLKVGARIMMVANDTSSDSFRRWSNGTLATIVDMGEKIIKVKLDNGDICDIEIKKWEKYQYSWNDVEGRIITDVIATYQQFPIKLAWASTIHKAQGLTLNDVRIDIKSGAFASGQIYVALSRATSMNGLSLAKKISNSDILVDNDIKYFLNGL